jgi:nitrogen fixation/metabolism regulation signal transduction histidine kinase
MAGQSQQDRKHEEEYGSRSFSLAGTLAAVTAGALALFAVLVYLGELLPWPLPRWLIFLVAFGITLPALIASVGRLLRPLVRTIEGLSDGIRSFTDHDFSMRISSARRDELGELARLYNRVGEILQDERTQIRQRELLLQSALDQSPIAIVLANPLDRVVYANQEARRLFLGGGRLVGLRFGEILEKCPEEMREVLASRTDGIFTVESEEAPETYHVAQRGFSLNRRPHRLYLLRRMTAELARQEAEIWKKVIRIISHELNNSLAPVSSLAHSGLLIARQHEQAERLEPIYASIRERVDYLTRFLEGYARFARLPKPKRQWIDWSDWLESPRKLFSFDLVGEPPSRPAYFDPSQLQQVLINLLKNAVEASDGEPQIAVRIDRLSDGATRVQVLDRGRGMDEEVMRKALVPFYSTKQTGTGVGLPLCREIVEAHGGLLRIQSRSGGGTAVSFWLPPDPPAE